MNLSNESGGARSAGRLRLVLTATDGTAGEWCFESGFRIGRSRECDVCIQNEYVSRIHAEGEPVDGQWVIRDLRSSNGLFLKSEKVGQIAVLGPVTFRMGVHGPELQVSVETEEPPVHVAPPPKEHANPADVAKYVEHYFGRGGAGRPAGEHTMLVRRAFQQVQTRQKRRFGGVIAAVLVAALAASGYALRLHTQVRQNKAAAQDLFYAMKALDVNIASLRSIVVPSQNASAASALPGFEQKRRTLEKNYNAYLDSVHVYDASVSPRQRLILRVARIFGECELAMPPGFMPEIENYIHTWQTSRTLPQSIQTANQRGYTKKIAAELLGAGLPPQFFYLALQESKFDPYASGPPTRKGIAKGMWQFIPETAVRYGMKIGPLFELARADPADDRHRWERETLAATQYLGDLYSTDAQASGLLVMACYNWGEDKVLRLVRSMPANPRERNFWRLLTQHPDKLPPETYDYVLKIVSAAVIGENPRLFGFDFDNPLAEVSGH